MIDEKTFATLKSIDTPTVCNAVEAFKIRDRTQGFMGYDIGCMFPELGAMLGYAVTATARTTVPGSPGSRAGVMKLWEAVENSPKPAVVVLKDVGPDRHRSCHYGDVMATISTRLGAVGLVTDGGVRDLVTVRKLKFHYFASGATPAHGNNEIVEVGLDVTISGALVRMGDLIHADENGVAVFPAELAGKLVEAAREVQAREAKIMERVRAADFKREELR